MTETLARISLQQMTVSLAAGTAIAASAWLLLRLAPRQNSESRFALWFAALLATVTLPLLATQAGVAGRVSADPGPGAAVLVPARWAAYGFAVWAAVAGVLLLRIALGVWQVRKLRRDSTELAPAAPTRPLPVDPAIVRLIEEFRVVRRVTLRASDAIRVPAAVGFFQPAVIVPSWLLRELPASELRQVILHELAHLRRRDDWTNLAQAVIRALLFFHPAVWWMCARLSLEREMACDDAVLAATASPHQYARCLALLAEKSLGRRRARLAQAAVERLGHMTLRVTRILDRHRPTRGRAWAMAGSLIVLATGIVAVSVEHAPRWIAVHQDAAVAAAPSVVGHGPSAYSPNPAMAAAPAGLERQAESRLSKPARRPVPSASRSAAGPTAAAPVEVALALGPRPQIVPVQHRTAATREAFVLAVYTEHTNPDGLLVQTWEITVWSVAQPPAEKQVPHKSI